MILSTLSTSEFHKLVTRSVLLPPALLGSLAFVFLGLIAYLLSAFAWVEHTNRVIAQAHYISKLLVDGETGIRGYLLTGDEKFLKPYQEAEAKRDSAFAELANTVSDNPPQVERLDATRTELAEWKNYTRNVVELRRTGGDYTTIVRRGDGKQRTDEMREQMSEFIEVEEGLRDTRSRAALHAVWVVAGASLAVALTFGVVLAVMTRRQLFRVSDSYREALLTAESRAESMRKSACRLETLHDTDLAILAAGSISETIRTTLRSMSKSIPSGETVVVAFGADGQPGQVITRDESRPGVQEVVLALSAALASTATLTLDRIIAIVTTVGQQSCLAELIAANGKQFGVLVVADPSPAAFNTEHQDVISEVSRQLAIAFQQAELREHIRRHAEELEQRVEERTRELREALDSVKQLEGLLPICAWCRKVRDGQDYWHDVEHYVSVHTHARFSHGICPACFEAQARGSGS